MNHNLGFKIVCLFHEITGLLCPGCGITRCLFAILNLDFKRAFYYNQLVFILLPLFGIYYIMNIYRYLLDKKRIEVPNYIVVILLFITLIFGVVRNLI